MKMKAIVLAGVLVLAAGCADSGAVTTGSGLTVASGSKPSTSSVSVKSEETPSTVRQAIQRAYPGSTIKSLDLVTDNHTGITHYQAKVATVQGKDVQVELSRQGKIVATKQ